MNNFFRNFIKPVLFILLFIIIQVHHLSAQVQLIPSGTNWRYHSGSAPASNWKDAGFNYLFWQIGFTPMGYGDGDENTLLYSGPISGNYPTYYFRKQINITDPSLYPNGLLVKVKRDDGFVFYVNGIEMYRNNTIGLIPQYTDPALYTCTDDGNVWISIYIPSSFLVMGSNVFATEIHQFESIGGDLSFDCTVEVNNNSPICVRGPYLQTCTENSIVIKWRTDFSCNSRVMIGNTYNVFIDTITDFLNTYNHEVTITGLTPSTKYYYTVGSTTSISVQDTVGYFYTPGPAGDPNELNIWVTGDCGTGFTEQINTANSFSNYVGNKYIDAWLLLGDNAYDSGLDNEYQTKFFNVYEQYRFISQTCIWPSPGNHDYYNTTDTESRNTPYFQIFTVPTTAEAGGIPSNTESYYSYNLANAHFISLDSYGTENSQKMYDTTSLQAEWLKQDLAANTQTWTIVYWHHPPYTKGSHNSDVEIELVTIREKLIKMMERFHVDLVLCGHSHQYERSKLIKGHYGLENTFDTLINLMNGSSAYYNGAVNSCPYFKKTDEIVNSGVVYVVAGSSGKHTTTSTGWPHNIMFYSNTSNSGSVHLNINNNRLDATFISETGTIQDKFTMMKDVNNSYDLLVPPATPVKLKASWIGDYYWQNTEETVRYIIISLNNDSVIIVEDTKNCIADTFHVRVGYVGMEDYKKGDINVYPNPTSRNFNLSLPILDQQVELNLYSLNGQLVFQKKWVADKNTILIDPGNIATGIYSVRIMIDDKIYFVKLIIS